MARRLGRGVMAVILVVTACAAPPSSPRPSPLGIAGQPGPSSSGAPGAPTSASTTPGDGSAAPGAAGGPTDGVDPAGFFDGWPADWPPPPPLPAASLDGPSAPAALPAPSLTEAPAIGEAIYDPARVDVAFVSLLEALGIGVDADDGTVLRPGRGDLRLPEGVVRSLIAQGAEDARAAGESGAPPRTFSDLAAALAPIVQGWDADRLAAAYDAAYRARPDDLVPQVLFGQPIEASTPLTTVQLWLLLVDGFVPLPVAAAPAGRRLAAAGAGAGTANPSLPDVGRIAYEAMVIMGLDGMIPVTMTPRRQSVHEGHGRPGPTVTFTVEIGAGRRHHAFRFEPRGRPNLATDAFWTASDPALLTGHGTILTPLGTRPFTGSRDTFRYRTRQERADPARRGPIVSGSTAIQVYLPTGALVEGAYDLPAELRGFADHAGHPASATLRVAWHGEEGVWLRLENEFDLTLSDGGMLSPVLTMGVPLAGSAEWSGTDAVEGFLEAHDDGIYRGTLVATVEDGEFAGSYAGTSCALAYSGTQWMDVVGEETADGFEMRLSFLPRTAPELSFTIETCPHENWLVKPDTIADWWPEELGAPPDVLQSPDAPDYLPFANARWTQPSIGYTVTLPNRFDPSVSYEDDEDDDPAEELGFGTSVWSVDEAWYGEVR